MPLLQPQPALLSREDLSAGIGKVFVERGAGDVADIVPFRPATNGKNDSFNVQSASPGNYLGANDPYATSITNEVHTIEKVTTEMGLIVKHADTFVIDIAGKSELNDQRAVDVESQAQLTYEEWVQHAVAGGGTGSIFRGLPYWLVRYFGAPQNDGTYDFTDTYSIYGGSGRAQFTSNILFGTNDGQVDGTKQTLSDTLLDDLVTLPKIRPQVLFATRQARNAIKAILNDMGGNDATDMMSEVFGRRMVHWDGIPVLVTDQIGDAKSTAATNVTVTTNTTVTVSTNDKKWPGFKPWDVGREITIGSTTTTIASVTDEYKCVVADTVTTQQALSMPAKPDIIIGTVCDERIGFNSVFYSTEGAAANHNVEVYGAPIMGFSAAPIGLLQSSEVERTRLRFYGNFTHRNPNALCGLFQFSLPTT